MRTLICSLLLLNSLNVFAHQAVSKIMQASVGTWKGELYYLDYQSGRRFGIPMQVDAHLTPDSATLVRKLTYTDPGVLVHAVNLLTRDRDTGELIEAFFREGTGDLFRYQITAADYKNEKNWELTYQHQGRDDDRPALIQHKITRAENKITSSKEVQFTDTDKAKDFIVRNGTDLTLVTD